VCTYEEVYARYHKSVYTGEDGVGIICLLCQLLLSGDPLDVYVQPILANATGVTITTMKLKIQFAVVAIALAGARISKGVISAG